MIRAETNTHWTLITHPDHAHLAGEFADAWGNDLFDTPAPFEPIRHAVYHHDDGWLHRDAHPSLTPSGLPEAFTRALVGAYSAFEEIDLPSYLAVRGEATAAVAAQNPLAGILVSMHTVNLLTEQADISTISPEHRPAHAAFVAAQQEWQATEQAKLGLKPTVLQRGFEFLQACDNLSLIVCSGFDEPRALRHRHPDRNGESREILCTPAEAGGYTLTPWPLREEKVTLKLPIRRVAKNSFHDLDSYRAAFSQAHLEYRSVSLAAG